MVPAHPVETTRTRWGWRALASGAVAGAVSSTVFAVVHDLLISDIWFSLVPMLIAGAMCGLSLAWSYGLLVEDPSVGGWVRYNALYVAFFGLLGAASVVVHEPVTTMAAVVAANEPPTELFARALPLTVGGTVAMVGVVSARYGRSWRHVAAVLTTCTLLTVLLGLNVSAIGLVAMPSGAVTVIAELLGLIALLALVFVAVFVALERRRFGLGSGRL